MKKTLKQLFLFLMVIVMISFVPITASASTKTNAEKVLSSYKKKKYKTAQRVANKLPKAADRTSINNLSKKAKTAFKKKVQKYPLSIWSKDYLWGYFLVDMDGDKIAELIIEHGSCEADARIDIYKFKNGKAVKMAQTYSGHTSFYAYPGHTGMIAIQSHMGYESLYTLKLSGKKVKRTNWGSREVRYDKGQTYLSLPQILDGHIRYTSNYSRSRVDYSDLS